jgi:hypothetical protein
VLQKTDTPLKIASNSPKKFGTLLAQSLLEPSQNMRANLFNHINTTNHETDTSFLRTRSADNEHSGHRMQKKTKTPLTAVVGAAIHKPAQAP